MHAGPNFSEPKINFKLELVQANQLRMQGNYHGAMMHYDRATREIERQLFVAKAALPEKLSPIYLNALFCFAECSFLLGDSSKAVSFIDKHPILFSSTTLNQTLVLLAKAHHHLGSNDQAISLIETNSHIVTEDLDENYLEAQFWLLTLLIKEHQLSKALIICDFIQQYLNPFQHHLEMCKNTNFWMYMIECTYHLGCIYHAQHQDKLAIEKLMEAKTIYKTYNDHIEIVDDEVKKTMLLVDSLLFRCRLANDDAQNAISIFDNVNLLDEVIVNAKNSTKIQYIKAFIIYIKLNHLYGKTLQAISALNKLLVWIQQGNMPKEFQCTAFLTAAELYLQPECANPELALAFLRIAQRAAHHLSAEQKANALIQKLIMDLICHHHMNHKEAATEAFDKLFFSISNLDAKDILSCHMLLQKFIPLFPSNQGTSYTEQVTKLIEVIQHQALIIEATCMQSEAPKEINNGSTHYQLPDSSSTELLFDFKPMHYPLKASLDLPTKKSSSLSNFSSKKGL